MKAQRIKAIRKMLRGVKDGKVSRIIAYCEYRWGLNPETTRRYLNVLEELELIVVDWENGTISEVSEE